MEKIKAEKIGIDPADVTRLALNQKVSRTWEIDYLNDILQT
jgi:hypothetical protein